MLCFILYIHEILTFYLRISKDDDDYYYIQESAKLRALALKHIIHY